jgi:hypothetical protein
MSRPLMDDELLIKNRSGSPSGESENTETWVRRAMLTAPESFAETVTSPDAETKQKPQTNLQPQDNKQTKSRPHSPLHKLWTCKGRQSGEDSLLQPSAVVEATMVCNSRDNLEIEITQGGRNPIRMTNWTTVPLPPRTPVIPWPLYPINW